VKTWNEEISDNKTLTTQVVFFTDGQHIGNPPEAIIQEIKLWSSEESVKTGTACAFHCVGFSAAHDVAFIQKIVNCGSEQGSFQYAENAASIPKCVSTLEDVLLDLGSR
jgi:hypothetical protein